MYCSVKTPVTVYHYTVLYAYSFGVIPCTSLPHFCCASSLLLPSPHKSNAQLHWFQNKNKKRASLTRIQMLWQESWGFCCFQEFMIGLIMLVWISLSCHQFLTVFVSYWAPVHTTAWPEVELWTAPPKLYEDNEALNQRWGEKKMQREWTLLERRQRGRGSLRERLASLLHTLKFRHPAQCSPFKSIWCLT